MKKKEKKKKKWARINSFEFHVKFGISVDGTEEH